MDIDRLFPIVLVFSVVVVSGCTGGIGNTSQESNLDEGTSSVSSNASNNSSINQESHMGCQPGAINKSGMCKVTVSDNNADVFAAEELKSIRGQNTSLNGTPGYYARPDDSKEYPSVIMIHEWWGLNQNIRDMADILAGKGYSVFAVDLYDGEVARNSSRALTLSNEVRENPGEAVSKMQSAVHGMRNKDTTTDKIASLGWCFGGGQSLQLSLSNTSMDGTVIYYGTLTDNKTELSNIEEPVLGIFGTEDQVVGQKSIRQFNSSLDELGVSKQIEMYEGASHAFANPSGESYMPNATKDAWNETLEFLEANLK